MKNILLIIVSFCFSIFSYSQKDLANKYAKTITPEELHGHLEILASNEYEGRETGMKGQKMATEYIVNYYKELGIDAQIQHYPLKKETSMGSSMKVNDKSYTFIDDFYFFGGFDAQKIETSDLIFVGYGIDSPDYNDYNNIDVNGKIVVALAGEPFDKNGKSLVTGTTEMSVWSEDWRNKRVSATKNGAKAILLVKDNYKANLSRIRYFLGIPSMTLDYKESRGEVVIPTVFIKPAILYEFYSEKTIIKQVKRIKKRKTVEKLISDKKLVIDVVRNKELFEGDNVLCFIEGTDSILKNEVVIISAHYDHIGIIDGEINNGADDDGSGTVATLEIAEAFIKAKNEGNGTRRSVLILNVTGEEKGLLGSEWYSNFPIYPLENTVCDLNIDMIGRTDDQHEKEEYVYIIGSDKLSTDLHKISEKVNSDYTKLDFDYTYNDPKDPNRFYYRSDHYNFAKNGIPVIFYFSGVHEDYHKPGDDVEKILFEKTATIAQLVFHTAWEVANRDEKLKVDVESDFE